LHFYTSAETNLRLTKEVTKVFSKDTADKNVFYDFDGHYGAITDADNSQLRLGRRLRWYGCHLPRLRGRNATIKLVPFVEQVF
jgi:hypothetical protein